MQEHCVWACEVELLAQHWQPGIVTEIVVHFLKRKAALKSARQAFAEVYERYFLNPSAEGAHW